MPVTSPASAFSLIESSVQIFLAVYRELAVEEIMKKANGKYDEGLKILESYRFLMTRDQIAEIAAMQKRVEAARPESGPTSLPDLIRNPLTKFTNARRFKKICKEYKQLVHRISQLARGDYLVFTSNKDSESPSQTFTPVIRAPHANEVRVFVTQEVALEIERAAGPCAEMTKEFCGLKISVGATASMNLSFTSSGSITVALGLIQDPSLAQREDGAALVLAASGELAQATDVVRNEHAPRHTTSQPDASSRIPIVISLSGTATILSRRSGRGVNHGDARRANAYGEDSSGRVTYALRLDNLTFHTEVNATLASD